MYFFRHWQTEVVHTSMNTKHFSGEFAFLLLVVGRKSCSSKFLPFAFFSSLLSAFLCINTYFPCSVALLLLVYGVRVFLFMLSCNTIYLLLLGFFAQIFTWKDERGEEWKGKESVPTKNATHVAFQIWHYSYYYWCCISNKMDSKCMKTCRCR